MEKLMKIIYVVVAFVLTGSAAVTTIVSICRHEWVSLIWLVITVISVFLAKGAIAEYRES